MDKQTIFNLINYEAALKAPRSSGGHMEVMEVIFEEYADVIARYIEDDYDGQLAYAYEFPDGTVCIITDYFGSCSGCDVWEEATDEEARQLIQSMVSSSRVFPDVRSAAEYCDTKCLEAFECSHNCAAHLKSELERKSGGFEE